MTRACAFEGSAPRQHKELVKTVQLEGQVLLKIIQHCSEALPQLVTGQLLGLDVGQQLEVTDCFAFPAAVADDDAEAESAGANYQLEMMRCLREVNVDNNTVGWYQSANMGTFQTLELIETFINYHENIKKCVCIIYDPQRSSRGNLALKAVRLKESFIELSKEQKLTLKGFREAGLSWRDIFVELPIKVRNSNLVQALVADLIPAPTATQADVDKLNLSVAPFLERNIQSLVECVDDIVQEQQKVTMYHKTVARQQQLYSAWLVKRRQENTQRLQDNLEALPEEDPTLFKPIPEPSMLDNYLVTNQIATYCDQINIAASEAIQKLFLMESMQKAGL
ncbi:eukaryotic translation initiation factor 3h [Volvox carteri f. nagariensis]|uniref:Eukaryotic translation initiation factor 3 subunit H n=1 Tax=Volvox carteri f. nagariensis TaxID=3068 RepID=D8U152_VOLCA|nr:eukaryotic translation initiation factor 3h [Volvox carteri f. nagariensis]EFJ46498.1 eukaryotic translation initiation factor 3h [Volvox carteri f. nagariensis]|eukprot:XP_002952355.1 eukaryotic translation initiation factor 3h [Volvox carteri f. nagariensis]